VCERERERERERAERLKIRFELCILFSIEFCLNQSIYPMH
jgi:hypothetical protein